MAQKHQDITCTLLRETHRWGDVALLACETEDHAPVTVKVECEPETLRPWGTYRFFGSWRTHYRYGRQFHAQTWVVAEPHGEAGVVHYLMQCHGIGPATARSLWQVLGPDAVRVLRTAPDVVAERVPGLSTDTAQQASQFLQAQASLEKCKIDLLDLLHQRGFPKRTHDRAIGEWGNRAAKLCRQNPYLLTSLPGCGFKRADQLYLHLGYSPHRLKRQALCLQYAILTSEGHTWLTTRQAEDALRSEIGGTHVQGPKAAKLGIRAGRLVARRSDGKVWLADARRAGHEAEIASHLKRLAASANRWPPISGDPLRPHQQRQLASATQGPVGILEGAPGTGKTFCASWLIRQICEVGGGPEQVAAVAPTGKAAVRLTELLRVAGVPLQAKTIHSTLRVEGVEGRAWQFGHNEDNPLPHRFYFVDEGSMLDADILAALLRAIPVGGHVLFVGDCHQLPPVGHGAPLRDMLRGGLPTGRLTEIQRNSGTIVRACHAIRAGKTIPTDPVLSPVDGRNLRLLSAKTPGRAREKILEAFQWLAAHRLADPRRECQLLVATNTRGQLNRRDCNRLLQRQLNPDGQTASGNPFRAGDKVVNLQNAILEGVDGGQVWSANGEIGYVRFVEPLRTFVELPGKGVVVVPRGGGDREADDSDDTKTDTGCNWDLGYALTVHKAQGSEWPVVLVALDQGARRLCSREWLYTAISRAKVACLPVGMLSTAQQMVRYSILGKRQTFLEELLHDR